jgi:hypothetical protein
MEDGGVFYGHLVYFVDFMFVWYIFPQFGMLHQVRSGNPGPGALQVRGHRHHVARAKIRAYEH